MKLRYHVQALGLCAIAAASGCAHGASLAKSGSPLRELTESSRRSALEHAQVWAKTDVPAMDLRAGPPGEGSLEPFAQISCAYVERKMQGASPKFTCELAPGDEVKIKYGADNREVAGVVAATRLLWALGFGADRWYPVSVTCHGCPTDARRDARGTTTDTTFETAALERKASGKTMEAKADEGWKWPELDLVNPAAGGAPSAQRDALKLLAVMLQHTDTKAQQQRLVCTTKPAPGDNGEDCATPVLLLHDVGLTFGKATLLNRVHVAGVNFREWSTQPIWKDAGRCIGNLAKSWTGTLDNPAIREPGRRFLADLLAQLTDSQLVDLFEVARFPLISHVPVEEWIRVFKHKRQEIAGVTCPS
jgi:hypothetical protein